MSNGIGDLIADTAVGMFSGERRLDNFISRRDKERERELAAAKIKALDLMSPAYKAKLMKDQGVRDPLYLDIGSSYDQYYKAFKNADDAAFADQLTKGYKTQNFIAGVGNELAGLAALAGVLPGVTIEGIYESLRTPYQYNKKYFGDLSEQEDREVQNFIENNAISVQGGRAIVLVPEIVASIATINPTLISRITGLMGRRNAGQTLSAVEQRQLLDDVREVEDFKMRNPNIGSISKTGDFTDVPDVRMAPQLTSTGGIKLTERASVSKEKFDSIINAVENLPAQSISVKNIQERTNFTNPSTIAKVIKARYGKTLPEVKIDKIGGPKRIPLFDKKERTFYTNQPEIDQVVKLVNEGLTTAEISKITGISIKKINRIAKTYSTRKIKRTSEQRNKDLENLATEINKLNIAETFLKPNSPIIKKLMRKTGLNQKNFEDEIRQLFLESQGLTGSAGKLRGLKLPGSAKFTENLKKFPRQSFVKDDLGLAGYSPVTISKVEDVRMSVAKISSSSTNFEHALPQKIISYLNLPRKYQLMGERTSSFLNQFKQKYDRDMLNVIKRYKSGSISLKQYNKEINAIRKEVRDLTGGYEIGYVKFVNGKAVPITPHQSALKKLGDLGRGTTGIINFLKNIKHHNALVKNFKKILMIQDLLY